MNFNAMNKKSIPNYLHLHKISHLEKTSQRDNYIWNWSDYAEDNCRIA
jgi:hypothetical protein